jgi:hypothetical protein
MSILDMKPVVNFINILLSNFSYQSASRSFSLITFEIFWQKNIGAKVVRKMLTNKLTP